MVLIVTESGKKLLVGTNRKNFLKLKRNTSTMSAQLPNFYDLTMEDTKEEQVPAPPATLPKWKQELNDALKRSEANGQETKMNAWAADHKLYDKYTYDEDETGLEYKVKEKLEQIERILELSLQMADEAVNMIRAITKDY